MKCIGIISAIFLCSAAYTDNIYVLDGQPNPQNLWSLFLPAAGNVPPPRVAIIAQPLEPEQQGGAGVLTISPDGATLYVFVNNGTIYSIPSDGLTAATLWATINPWDDNKEANGIAASTTPGSVYVLVYDHTLPQDPDAIILVSPSGQQTIANWSTKLARIVIASDSLGYAIDSENNQIVQIALDSGGTITTLVQGNNYPPGDFYYASGIAITPDGTTLVVVTAPPQVLSPTSYVYAIPIANPTSYQPIGQSVDPFDSVAVVSSGRDALVMDGNTGQILKFPLDGSLPSGTLVSNVQIGGSIVIGPTP